MKLIALLIGLVVLAFVASGCQQKERYKIVSEGGVIMKIDTDTGQSWRWTSDGGPGGRWAPIDTPH
ncbi:MAG: hypothetical protein ACJ8KU_08145 [Chthoniobacterales bacterium]